MLGSIFEKLNRFTPKTRKLFTLLSVLMMLSVATLVFTLPNILFERSPLQGGHISISTNSSREIPIPYQEQTFTDLLLSHLIFGRAAIVRQGEIIPDLADIRFVDGDTYITPRKNITFHNGLPITLSDVMYSFTEALSTISTQDTPSLEKLENEILISDFDDSSPFFKDLIEAPWVSEDLFTQYPPIKRISNLGTILAGGSGPYQLKNSDEATTVFSLHRVRSYPGPHYAHRITITTKASGTDPHTFKADVALQESEALTVPEIGTDASPVLLPTRKIIGLLLGKRFVTEQFDAVRDLVNQASLPNKLFGTHQFSFIPFDDTTIAATKTGASARDFEITYPDNTYFKFLAESIQAEALSEGIFVTLKPVQAYTLKSLIESKDFDTLLYGYEISSPNDIALFFKSSNTYPVGLNMFGINSSDIDTRISTPLVHNQYLELNKKLFETKTFIPFISPHMIIFAKKHVRGIVDYNKDRSLDLFEEPRFWYTSEKIVW